MSYTPKEKILTAGELCKWWGITKDQLDRLRKEGGLPYVMVARGVYIFIEKALADWCRANLNNPLVTLKDP